MVGRAWISVHPKCFAGREFDQTFLSALPDGADPCVGCLGQQMASLGEANGVHRVFALLVR